MPRGEGHELPAAAGRPVSTAEPPVIYAVPAGPAALHAAAGAAGSVPATAGAVPRPGGDAARGAGSARLLPGPASYPPQVPPSGHRRHRQAGGKHYALRGAESFWYILGCISFGTAYFSKLPGKKAACEVFSELQLDGQGPSRGYSLRGAEGFWYVLMCIPFGAGYFAKVSAKKALWEMVGMVRSAPGEYAEAISRALCGAAAPYPPRFRPPR